MTALVPQFSVGLRRSALSAVALLLLFVGVEVHASTVTFARFHELDRTHEPQDKSAGAAETGRVVGQPSPELPGDARSQSPSAVNFTPGTFNPGLVTSVLPEPDPRTALGYLVGVIGCGELLRRFRRAWMAVEGNHF